MVGVHARRATKAKAVVGRRENDGWINEERESKMAVLMADAELSRQALWQSGPAAFADRFTASTLG
jgi:hypothetical protein